MKASKKFTNCTKLISFELSPEAIDFSVDGGCGRVEFVKPGLIFIRKTANQELADYLSYAVETPLDEWVQPNLETEEQENALILRSEKLSVKLQKEPFQLSVTRIADGEILVEDYLKEGESWGFAAAKDSEKLRTYKHLTADDHFYGFGEKTGHLDKRGTQLKMENSDMPYWKDKDPLYQSHPFFITIRSGKAFGIFLDNISTTVFDMGEAVPDAYFMETTKGDLNYFIMDGPSLDRVLEVFTELTGRIELPPQWAVGNHQCRYSYKNEKQMRKITEKYREAEVPCDGIWFDIHYLEGYRVFTVNEKRFPDFEGLVHEMRDQGFRSTVIVDPGVKVDEDYPVYQELIENKYYATKQNGEPAIGYVWPGLTNFPDFTRPEVRDWWADLHQFYFEKGVEGIWNDMNEPALSINPIKSLFKDLNDMYLWDHGRNTKITDCRNIYGLCEAKSTWSAFKKFLPNKRPFILTRAGYSGIQKYAATWTGDNWSNWYNVALGIRMCLNLGLSAQAFAGADIGGHMSIRKMVFQLRNREQFIRFLQSGVFCPFCRIHTSINTPSQDPFSYGSAAQEIIKKYIELRYRLLPLWYTLFHECSQTGRPILRPLFYQTPEDELCHDKRFENQCFLGENLLIVPISKKGQEEIEVYLPKGNWVHFWTLEEFAGEKIHRISVTLEDLPIFARKGCILPLQEVMQHTLESTPEVLNIRIFKGSPGTSATLKLYYDDGNTMDYQTKKAFGFLNITANFLVSGVDILHERMGEFPVPWNALDCEIVDAGEICDRMQVPLR